MKRLRWLLIAAACLAGTPGAVQAQDIDPQARAAARTLVQDGDALWAKGDYAGALDRFTRAYGLVNAPTIAIRQAECFEKLGRLVEASEKYMAVSRRKLGPGAPDAFKRAVATALERVNAVRERLAMLELTIDGDNVADAQVFVDGREIPPALVGATFPVDPGERVVEVVKGSRKVSEKISLKEKEKKSLTLTLPPGEDEPETPTPPTQPTQGTAQPPTTPVTSPAGPGTEPTTSSQSTWGWVSLGIGAAGLVAGGTTGFIAMGKRSTLDETCIDEKCPPSDQDDVDSYNQMRTISTIGFGVGLVGVGAGLTLLLTAPDPQPSDHAGVRPWVGLGSAGVEGQVLMRTTMRWAWFAGVGVLCVGCMLPAYEVDESLGGEGGSGGTLPELPPPPDGCGGDFKGGPDMVSVRGGYCIDKTEVTWQQYTEWSKELMLNPGTVLTDQPSECSWNLDLAPGTSYGCSPPPDSDLPIKPVVCVDWCDARLYCQSMGKRLCGSIEGGKLALQDKGNPALSQWTNACSSGGRYDYPYGNEYKAGACYVGGQGQPEAVETYLECASTEADYEGVYDLSGNVSEWEDSCDSDKGMGANCLARGGSFDDKDKEDVSCTAGQMALRQSTINTIGFRCCWGPAE